MRSKSAVIMGDIIGSQNVIDVQKMHRLFNEVITEINKEYEDDILSPLTITLGDEFQGLISNLYNAFEIASRMRFFFFSSSA